MSGERKTGVLAIVLERETGVPVIGLEKQTSTSNRSVVPAIGLEYQ